ncbi:MAG: deoxyribonuclease IV [Bacteroidota bacterium]
MTKTSHVDLLGAHTSAAGGGWHALEEGIQIGATMVQFFTANQRQWNHRPLTKEAIRQFQTVRQSGCIQKVMSHSSYLINLGSPDPEGLTKSRAAFRQEILRCQALGVDYLNFHPGAALKGSRQDCLDRIVESLTTMEDLLHNSTLTLLFESTAGQGSTIGVTFEELGYLIEKSSHLPHVGICLDTCHLFAAGYDIRTAAGWHNTLQAFDNIIGLDYLQALHLNDSLRSLASRKDRHAPLGKGAIGLECFQFLMQSPLTRDLPMCLETPGGCEQWQKELILLRGFRTT